MLVVAISNWFVPLINVAVLVTFAQFVGVMVEVCCNTKLVEIAAQDSLTVLLVVRAIVRGGSPMS